jgi:hypothetical protein
MNTITLKQQDAENIIKEVKSMRTLQKSYFKSRYDDPVNSSKILSQSKLQEKKVDEMIENFLKPKNELF